MYELIILTLAILALLCLAGAWYAWREEKKDLEMRLKYSMGKQDYYLEKWKKWMDKYELIYIELSKYKRPRDDKGRFK